MTHDTPQPFPAHIVVMTCHSHFLYTSQSLHTTAISCTHHSHDTPQPLPAHISHHTPPPFPAHISHHTPQPFPEHISNHTPQSFPAHISHRTPQPFPVHIRHHTPQPFPAHISHHTPQPFRYREAVSHWNIAGRPRSYPLAELKCRARAAFRHEMNFLRENEDQLLSQ